MTLFSELLRSLREQAGLTQRGLARRLSVPQSYIWKLENAAKTPPSVAQIRRIVSALGLGEGEIARLVTSARESRSYIKLQPGARPETISLMNRLAVASAHLRESEIRALKALVTNLDQSLVA
ncbi:helix-turn-helix domain-containing protein [Burkholderia cenocepacia]|uniref:helix-turn-helix domain-containing protein n=1 Tax=Burkholderia cenocepacia TaxID=95486 RepID=UPI00158B7E4F|nr:helix-turn-helix transcriptional regulator [Burkholderia cenocepacia]